LSDGQTAAAAAADRCNKVGHIQGGSKSKLLILSEYVKKTRRSEEREQIRTARDKMKLSDIFTPAFFNP